MGKAKADIIQSIAIPIKPQLKFISETTPNSGLKMNVNAAVKRENIESIVALLYDGISLLMNSERIGSRNEATILIIIYVSAAIMG